jgi:hypothetical protein
MIAKWLTISIGILIVIALLSRYLSWWAVSLDIADPGTFTTAQDIAKYTDVQPPPQAHDFRVAHFSGGVAISNFVRFAAPVDVCLQYVKLVTHKEAKTLTQDQVGQDLESIQFASSVIHDLRWFDLPYTMRYWKIEAGRPTFLAPHSWIDLPIPEGVVGTSGRIGILHSEARVDITHGIFYFYQYN